MLTTLEAVFLAMVLSLFALAILGPRVIADSRRNKTMARCSDIEAAAIPGSRLNIEGVGNCRVEQTGIDEHGDYCVWLRPLDRDQSGTHPLLRDSIKLNERQWRAVMGGE